MYIFSLLFGFILNHLISSFSWPVIGRVIRHINDYAAILLVDSRYTCASDPSKRSLSHPTSKLPQWIKNRLVSSSENYGEVHRMLHQFFKFNKNQGIK